MASFAIQFLPDISCLIFIEGFSPNHALVDGGEAELEHSKGQLAMDLYGHLSRQEITPPLDQMLPVLGKRSWWHETANVYRC